MLDQLGHTVSKHEYSCKQNNSWVIRGHVVKNNDFIPANTKNLEKITYNYGQIQASNNFVNIFVEEPLSNIENQDLTTTVHTKIAVHTIKSLGTNSPVPA